MKVKRWFLCSWKVQCYTLLLSLSLSLSLYTHIVANLLPDAASPLSFDYSSDILRSVIMRTKVLMLNLLEGCDPGVVITDMYDLFQVNPDPIVILALTLLALALNLNLSLSVTLTWGLLG
jgi:hypothetical protein